jgi:glycosyltransferase involved in cell wall biosynthesis
MAAPLISIVIATRNVAGLLPRCLDSIRAQTCRDFEVLVADGASSDATLDVVRAYADVVTAWDSQPDSGPYAARNRMIPKASGEWICFLGADDWLWDERVLERLAPQLRVAAPRHRMVYSRLRLVDSNGAVISEAGEPWEGFKAQFRAYRCLPHPGLMHHRSVFAEHGLFDESFKMVGDYELLLRELKTRDALFVPVLSVGMGFRGQTSSPEYFHAMFRELRRALAMHGLAPPRLRWAFWMLTGWCYARLHALLGDRNARRLADAYRVLTFRKPRYSGSD